MNTQIISNDFYYQVAALKEFLKVQEIPIHLEPFGLLMQLL